MTLKEKIRNLPSTPGVYLMKDSLGGIIYVGKSKNLKSRVSSYFVNSSAHSPKIKKLVKHLKDFDHITTDTEFEAFMLECQLIKSIKPLYNSKMKSILSYPYISINMKETHPSFELTYEPDDIDGRLYWGPYTSKNTVERGLEALKEFYKIPCNNRSKKTSTCFNHSLGLCIGVCLGGASQDEYNAILENIIELLNGQDNDILEKMSCKMTVFSEKFDFENAAKYRDYIGAVNYLINKVKVIEFTEENKNIALLEPLNDEIIKFFLIKGSKVLFSEKYSIRELGLENLRNILKDNIISKLEDKATPSKIGKEELDESQIIYSYLKSNTNNCKHTIIPQDWINAKTYDKIIGALEDLT
jgi:excinuclease ABC subunit C